MKTKRHAIDIGLAVIAAVRADIPADARMSCRDIAAVCGCSWQNIWRYEQKAIAKLRRSPKGRELRPQ